MPKWSVFSKSFKSGQRRARRTVPKFCKDLHSPSLGVLFDWNLGFEKQTSAMVKSRFFHLRRLSRRSKVRPQLAHSYITKLVTKIVTFVFKSLQNQAPSHLSEAISTYKPNSSLRSSNLGLLSVPSQRWSSLAVTGPGLWNKFPASIRAAPSLPVFQCRLKKHIFSIAFI